MIHPDTFSFLSELATNNHKEWFDQNRSRYQAAKANFLQTTDSLIEALIDIEPTYQGLEAKDCMFRIFRDVRFSKNKSPYKTNFGASISRGGRKSAYAGYYFHIQEGNCFLGGGKWHPDAGSLKKIRAHIDLEAAKLRELTSSKQFLSLFGQLEGDALKTAPKGYPKDHPDIDLIRRKDFFVVHRVSDEFVQADDFNEKAMNVLKEIQPLTDYLNEALEA